MHEKRIGNKMQEEEKENPLNKIVSAVFIGDGSYPS